MQLSSSKTWFKMEGASAQALRILADVVTAGLPQEYLDLLAYSNGGEGQVIHISDDCLNVRHSQLGQHTA
ncbi:hypothetical protein J2X19_000727 [Rhodoferax ferrireducens]|uniref:Uncharacterized protein n=1 Tax=Rhodoferax ferrireducens TaxID=192843 RepID=A0ABU2C438_9BURK|nr:hypothetical protein [Rhodoferax ferrireducens]MDR7376069.1 hypothetical protein [Rhodoferax ferrireducens]